jgi:hypothetical protein
MSIISTACTSGVYSRISSLCILVSGSPGYLLQILSLRTVRKYSTVFWCAVVTRPLLFVLVLIYASSTHASRPLFAHVTSHHVLFVASMTRSSYRTIADCSGLLSENNTKRCSHLRL